jgi:hypothetical protein
LTTSTSGSGIYGRELLWNYVSGGSDSSTALKEYNDIVSRVNQSHPLLFSLLDERFFQRLETAGGVRLLRPHREIIVSVLALLAEANSSAGLTPSPVLTRNARQLLRTTPQAEVVLRQELTRFIAKMEIGPRLFSRRRIRARLTWVTEDVARHLIRTYSRAGGEVSFPHKDQRSFRGPLPDFLCVAWHVMPVDRRRNSCQSYISMAAKAWRVSKGEAMSSAGMAAVEEVQQLAKVLPMPAGTSAFLADIQNGGRKL